MILNLLHKKFIKITIIAVFIIVNIMPISGQAQLLEKLTIDAKASNDYIRVMFYADNKPELEASLQNNTIIINFKKNFETSFSNLLSKSNKNIMRAYINNSGNKITINLNNEKKYRIRSFKNENFTGLDIIIINDDKKANENNQLEEKNKVKEKKKIIPKPVIKEQNKIADDHFYITFPWRKPVAATIFTRDKNLWIIFNEKFDIETKDLLIKNNKYVDNIEKVDNPEFMILVFKLKEKMNIKAYKNRNNWIVESTKQDSKPLESLKIKQRDSSTRGPHLFIFVKNQTSIIRVIDPFIGDTLFVMPLYDNSLANDRDYNKIDVKLFKTAQGLAGSLINDKVRIQSLRKGVEISLPSIDYFGTGITDSEISNKDKNIVDEDDKKEHEDKDKISSKEEKILNQIPEIEDNIFAWFQFSDLVGLKPNTARDKIINLNYDNLFEKDPIKRFMNYYQIARLYFYRKLYLEASIYLEKALTINNMPDALYNDAAFLQAVSHYMIHRYKDADKSFDKVNYKILSSYRKNEFEFWQAANKARKENMKNEKFNYIKNIDQFINAYPYNIRYKLALFNLELNLETDKFSTDYNLSLKELEESQKLIQTLRDEGNFNNHSKNFLDYLEGLYFLRKGDRQKALHIWNKIDPDFDERYNRIIIKFASVLLKLKENTITKKDAIDELERMNLLWRGGNIEKEVLEMLGQLYYEEGEFIEAMRIWNVILRSFPGTQFALLTTKKISETFIKLYNEGEIDRYDIITILSFYDEFKEFTPIGRQGDIMIQNLANKLIRADLLDRAAALLEYQIRFRLSGNERAIVATRLALIYLMNNLPTRVEEVIQSTENIPISNILKRKRDIIVAHAYVMNKEYDKALNQINFIYNQEALKVRSEVYWRTSNWKELEKLLTPYFKNRDKNPNPITKFEKIQVVRLASAYANIEKYRELKVLYYKMNRFFAPDSAELKLFSFISNSVDNVDYRNLENTVNITALQTFLDDYRNSVLDGGLEAILPDNL